MNRKIACVLIISLLLLIPLVFEIQVIKPVFAGTVQPYKVVQIVYPRNETYYSNQLTLNITFPVGGLHYTLWYALDGNSEGSIPWEVNNPNNELHVVYEAVGSVNMPKLTQGPHHVEVTIQVDVHQNGPNPPNGAFHPVSPGSSDYQAIWTDTVDFTIASPDADPSPSPSVPTSEAVGQVPTNLSTQAIAYIQNVLPIDTSEYTITFKDYRDNANATYSTRSIQCLTYNLENNQNVLIVTCVFSDGVPCDLAMRIQSGSLPGVTSDSNLISITDNIVREHLIRTKTYSSKLLDLLDMLNPENNQSQVSVQDITLILTHAKVPRGLETTNGQPHITSGAAIDAATFTWKNSNGLTDPSAVPLLMVAFKDGVFYSLHDNRYLLSTSQESTNANPSQNTDITLTEDSSLNSVTTEQAIAITAIAFVVVVTLLLFVQKKMRF